MAIDRLIAELEGMLDRVADGSLVGEDPFRDVPAADRALRDIAFSGDGEPTAYRNIDTIVAAVADLKRRRGLDEVKIVLITNASLLDRPHVRRALTVLDLNQGEVWAKLDAGTPAWFDRVNRTGIPFDRILRNLRETALARPIVIQSLFLRLDGQAPPAGEIDAYLQRLREIQAAGGHIARVQVYTIARPPAEAHAVPLETPILEDIASRVVEACEIPVEVFPGRGGGSG
jgi:wyosine [tRNA(Phe)-imidazoG37] synthetase (radical SAM superfamily)